MYVVTVYKVHKKYIRCLMCMLPDKHSITSYNFHLINLQYKEQNSLYYSQALKNLFFLLITIKLLYSFVFWTLL